ncbi:hypothetical protein ES705_43634 [subsurface metagenome]
MNRVAGHADKSPALPRLPDYLSGLLTHFLLRPRNQAEGTAHIAAQTHLITKFSLGLTDIHPGHGVDGMKSINAGINYRVIDGPDIAIGVLDYGNSPTVRIINELL